MVGYQERTVSVRGGKLRINVLEGGSGDPLVFIHGAGGLPGWASYLDRMAQDFNVYAPYHPGVGASEGIEHLDDTWDLSLFYEELLDALGLQNILLVGQSYGGMVAAELAAQCPKRIRRLVLIGSLGLWLDHTPMPDFFVSSPEERARNTWYDPISKAAKAALAVPKDPEKQVEAELENTKTLAAIAKFIWPIPDRGLIKRIHRITAPTLLLWGVADGVVPPVYGKEFQRLIPGSRLKIFERCGHRPHEECPEEFFATLMPFLKQD